MAKATLFRITATTLLIVAAARTPAATAQTLVWENRGQAELRGGAVEAQIAEHVVVASGATGDAASEQWFVRGMDRKTGQTTWEDRFGPVIFGFAKDIVVVDGRAFAAGWILTPGLGYGFVVRAYDVNSGLVLWSREVSRGPQCGEEHPGFSRCVAKTLKVHDGRVFVAGHLTRTSARADFAVLAFDAATGEPLWESVTDPTGTGANDYAWSVAAEGDHVFVLGEIGDMSALLVQAHDAATGQILWQQRVPGATNFTLNDTLAASRRTVFISGMDDQQHFFVRAYDAETGVLRWQDRVDEPGQVGAAFALALERGESDSGPLFAAGVAGCNPVTFLECELAVRAYDPVRGLIWQRSDRARGGDWADASITAGEGRVFVSSDELLEDGAYHGTVRAYTAENGAFKWSAPFDDGSGQPISFVEGMAVREGGLVVTGQIQRADGHFDFLVRMYRPH